MQMLWDGHRVATERERTKDNEGNHKTGLKSMEFWTSSLLLPLQVLFAKWILMCQSQSQVRQKWCNQTRQLPQMGSGEWQVESGEWRVQQQQ